MNESPAMKEAERRMRKAIAEYDDRMTTATTDQAREDARYGLMQWLYAEATPERVRMMIQSYSEEVETAIERVGAPKGGQHVPDHSELVRVPLSGLLALRRWFRDLRESAEVKP